MHCSWRSFVGSGRPPPADLLGEGHEAVVADEELLEGCQAPDLRREG